MDAHTTSKGGGMLEFFQAHPIIMIICIMLGLLISGIAALWYAGALVCMKNDISHLPEYKDDSKKT